jgi:hypothetical protein
MASDQRRDFALSFVTTETERPAPPASAILEQVRSRPAWDSASISPIDAQFPLLHVEWREGLGYMVQCYEDASALSDFLTTAPDCGHPSVQVELGGQALELWPPELFVPHELAHRAVEHFLASGTQDRTLAWVRLDAFPRETIWEGREGREAWERANRSASRDVRPDRPLSRRAARTKPGRSKQL